MTTTIVPASGAGALFTQQGTGTSPGYSALDDRRSSSGSLQEGVFGTSTLVTAGGVSNVGQADFMITQRAAGANMSVDVNMPAGGFGYVQGDTVNGQGLYCVPVHSANINEAIAAADATFPRIDQLILEIQDNVLDASGGNLARTRVLTGTPTSGATLANRTGAVALPGNALLLADVLVGNGVTSLANVVMRDRRKWARGAGVFVRRNAADYTTTSASFVDIDSVNMQPRIECSGAPLVFGLYGRLSHSITAGLIAMGIYQDGGQLDGEVGPRHVSRAATEPIGVQFVFKYIPSAGSHTFSPRWLQSGGTATLAASAATPMEFFVYEEVRQNTANNVVTTG